MINDSSIFTSLPSPKKIKSMLICKNCKSFPLILKIFLKKDEIFISYKCNCEDIENIELKTFIEKFKIDLIINDSISVRTNNTYTFRTVNNKEIDINVPQIPHFKECKCKDYSYDKQFMQQYFCGDCNLLTCFGCRRRHILHRIIYPNLIKKTKISASFYNRKRRNLLQFESILSIFAHKKNGNKFKMEYEPLIKEYYNKNLQQSELLFNLYILLKNNYEATKFSTHMANYVNLKFFSFQYDEGFRKEIVKNKKLLIQNFLLYCKTNFWIKVDGAIGYFSSNGKEIKISKNIDFHKINVGNVSCFYICLILHSYSYSRLAYSNNSFQHKTFKIVKTSEKKGLLKSKEEFEDILFFKTKDPFIQFINLSLNNLKYYSLRCHLFFPLSIYRFALSKENVLHISHAVQDTLRRVDEMEYKEKDIICSLFVVKRKFLLIQMKNKINVMDIKSFKIINSIELNFTISEVMKYYEVLSLNLLVISTEKEIIIVNLSIFQVMTVIIKQNQSYNIGIINNKILVMYEGNYIQLICLKSLKILSRMYIDNLSDIHQIKENRFIFCLSTKKGVSLVYYYL